VGAVTQTTITGLVNQKAYTFRVAATNAYGTGAPRASAAITVGAPAPPTGVTAKQYGDTGGAANAAVHWTAGANNGSAVTSYLVTMFQNGVAKSSTRVAAPATGAIVRGLSYGKPYTYRVIAGNARGSG